MRRGFIPQCILLVALSTVCIILFYQCHTALSGSQKKEDIKRKTRSVMLDDIREGMLVRKVVGTGLYEVLPQRETEVQINIEGMVASTTVEQVFTNSSEDPIEALYVFPLPQNAALHDMKMLMHNRFIQGMIMEKKRAGKTCASANGQSIRAGLTEQQRPNIFISSIANIMPGDTITVRLQYAETLMYEEGTFSIRFPMVAAPRYVPGNKIIGYSGNGWLHDTDVVPDASRVTPPVVSPETRSGNPLTISVNINAGLPIASINSKSHDIQSIQVDERAYRIELKKQKTIPNKDFILEYQIKFDNEPKAALFAGTKDDDDYFMLMTVPPLSVNKDKANSKDIISVLDISGSMAGISIEQAREESMNVLNLLDRENFFNIIAFNDRYEAFAPRSVAATTTSIVNGINYINSLYAGGGTEALPALKEAMNMTGQPDAFRIIIFLTDGSVGNEDQLLALVNRHIGVSRLFTVDIGSAPNGYLLEKAAQFGRGTFTYVSDIDNMELKMSDLFSKIAHPVLMDLKLKILEHTEVYPDPLPDLFAGQPLIVFGKADVRLSAGMTLIGRTSDGTFTAPIPFSIDTAASESAIPTLWAQSKIANLMDEYRLGSEDVKQEIIDLAINHNLMTQFTSFVAVEHKVVNPDGDSRLSVIPGELPEGWEYDKISDGEYSVDMAYLSLDRLIFQHLHCPSNTATLPLQVVGTVFSGT